MKPRRVKQSTHHALFIEWGANHERFWPAGGYFAPDDRVWTNCTQTRIGRERR